MEILRAAEVLPEKFRAENPAVLALNEASIGLAREEELSGAEDDQRKGTAQQDGEDKRRTKETRTSLRKVFMVFLARGGGLRRSDRSA